MFWGENMDRKKTSKDFNNEINIIELSNKKPTRKRLSDVEYNKTETTKRGVNKNLFKVDNYAEFDFRANRKTAKTESVASTLAVSKTETVKKTVSPKTKKVAEKKTTPKAANVTKKKTTPKAAKKSVKETISIENALEELRRVFDISINEVDVSALLETKKTTTKVVKKPAKKTSDTDSLIVNDKKATAVLKLRVDDDERAKVVALACNNTNFDESAERIVRIARMGLLFD